MKKRTVYKRLVCGAGVLLVAGLALFYLVQDAAWVGSTDVEVSFIVTDTESGQPIANAMVHVSTESDGFCDDPPQPNFAITTDQNGRAKHLCTNCMCSGRRGAFVDTFASHLPSWSYHATATGYSKSDPAHLSGRDNLRNVQRGSPNATLSVPIQLRRDGG